jgi:hypothetical protein
MKLMSKQEDKLLHQLCSVNERQAESLLRNSLYSFRRYESISTRDVSTPLKNSNAELDSTTIALNFIQNNESLKCDCHDYEHLKKAQADLKTELKKTELAKEYIGERKSYLQKVAGTNDALKKSVQSLEKTDYYFAQNVQEFCNIYKDRSGPEQVFFKFLGSLMPKANLPSSGLLATIQNSSATSANVESMATALTQFESAASKAGSSAGAAISGENPLQKALELAKEQTPKESEKLLANETNSVKQYGELIENTDASSIAVEHDSTEVIVHEEKDSKDWKKNPLKSKRLQDRLFYGLSFQANPHTSIFPTTGAINSQVGFQMTKNMNVGLGGSYLVGFDKKLLNENRAIKQIQSNGYTWRAFADHRIKQSLFLQIGYENSFRRQANGLNVGISEGQSENYESLLAVLKLKTPARKKSRKTVELLYDFRHRHTGQPAIVFRAGLEFLPKHSYR